MHPESGAAGQTASDSLAAAEAGREGLPSARAESSHPRIQSSPFLLRQQRTQRVSRAHQKKWSGTCVETGIRHEGAVLAWLLRAESPAPARVLLATPRRGS